MVSFKRIYQHSVIILIFIASSVRIMVAQMVPARGFNTQLPDSDHMSGDRRAGLLLLLSQGSKSPGTHGYGLEATGIFPFVRFVTLPVAAVPVPVEIAAQPIDFAAAKRQSSGFQLTHRALPQSAKGFVITTEQSCSFCSGCSSCGNCGCSSCTPSSCCP